MVQGKIGSGHEISNVRTSKTAWLAESVHPILPILSRRISLITGLKTDPFQDQAELLQVKFQLFKNKVIFKNNLFFSRFVHTKVANYGIGGHYSPHHDYLMKNLKENDVSYHYHARL